MYGELYVFNEKKDKCYKISIDDINYLALFATTMEPL